MQSVEDMRILGLLCISETCLRKHGVKPVVLSRTGVLNLVCKPAIAISNESIDTGYGCNVEVTEIKMFSARDMVRVAMQDALFQN